jgi:hypothetical protein
VEEREMNLPASTSPGNIVRIPPEMMPSEQQAQQYIEYFFNNIHPFVPVINKDAFCHDWQHRRDEISPLLLESVFACATSMTENHPEGNKWLALASSTALSDS